MKWISSKQAAELGKSLAAIVLALVIGALFILVAGESPATAYSSLLKGLSWNTSGGSQYSK